MSTPHDTSAPLPVRQEHHLPESIRARVNAEAGYRDSFALTTANAAAATPRQWAGTTFEDVAGRGGQFIWRGLLGLRLKHGAERIAGWEITGQDEDWIRLEAHSWMLTGQLLVHVSGEEVWLVTAIAYKRRIGRLVWTPLSAIHRALAPGLLRDAHNGLFPQNS